MKKVYKSKHGEQIMNDLYDRQLECLNIDYQDIYVKTRFGDSHVLKVGKLDGKPLLLFHGGNSTTPYYLDGFKDLLSDFCVYAVDTIGHPGKSAQTVISAKTMAYGEWASDVIDGLGFKQMCCMGGSYGGGILVKLMSVSPEKVEKAVLIVPSGIANISTFSVMNKMGIPMIAYSFTKKEKWLRKAILPMAIEEKNIDDKTYEMVKLAFDNAAIKAGMPSNASKEDLKRFIRPTLLIAAEKDCLFPGEEVISVAQNMIQNLQTHLLLNQGHLCVLSKSELTLIKNFLNS